MFAEVPDGLHRDGRCAAIAGWVAHHEQVPYRNVGGVVRRPDQLDRPVARHLPACRVFLNGEGWAVAVAADGTGPVIGQSRGVVHGFAAWPNLSQETP